jgi:hypothetical protein
LLGGILPLLAIESSFVTNPSYAQLTQLTDCVAGTTLHIAAQTQNYFIQICKTNSDTAKLIFNPRSGQVFNRTIVSIPLTSTQQFVGVSGNTRYFLNAKILRVVKNNRLVIREKILKWEVKG